MQTEEELEIEEIKKENEDLKTQNLRAMFLNLTNMQVEKLENISQLIDKSPSQILESFIADLVDCHRNGSDEMHLANNWFERRY